MLPVLQQGASVVLGYKQVTSQRAQTQLDLAVGPIYPALLSRPSCQIKKSIGQYSKYCPFPIWIGWKQFSKIGFLSSHRFAAYSARVFGRHLFDVNGFSVVRWIARNGRAQVMKRVYDWRLELCYGEHRRTRSRRRKFTTKRALPSKERRELSVTFPWPIPLVLFVASWRSHVIRQHLHALMSWEHTLPFQAYAYGHIAIKILPVALA